MEQANQLTLADSPLLNDSTISIHFFSLHLNFSNIWYLSCNNQNKSIVSVSYLSHSFHNWSICLELLFLIDEISQNYLDILFAYVFELFILINWYIIQLIFILIFCWNLGWFACSVTIATNDNHMCFELVEVWKD
jgi:hypothetical protein